MGRAFSTAGGRATLKATTEGFPLLRVNIRAIAPGVVFRAKNLELVRLAAVAAFLGAAVACSEEEERPATGLDSFEPDVRDAGASEDAADGTNEASDGPSDEGNLPPERTTSDCPPLEMPGAADALGALHALTLTSTRVYAASQTAIHAFERVGGCAGPRIVSFGDNGVLAGGAQALAGADADRLLAATAAGTVLLDGAGSALRVCSDARAHSLGLEPSSGTGFAALGARLLRISVDATGCAVQDFGLSKPAFAVSAVGADRDGAALVALVAEPGGRLELRRETGDLGESIDQNTACSARALIRTQLGIATLDPTCSKLRFLDVTGERYRVSLPAGEVARALAMAPGASPELLTLASVSEPGVAPRLRTVEVVSPGRD